MCQAMPPRFNTVLHGRLSGARRCRHGSTRFYTGGCQVPGEAATVQHGFTRAVVRCRARPPRFNTVLHGRLSGAGRGRHGSTRFYTGGCQVPGEAATVQHGFTRAVVRCQAMPPRFNTVLHGRLSGARRGRHGSTRFYTGDCQVPGGAANVGAGPVPARWPVRASVAVASSRQGWPPV